MIITPDVPGSFTTDPNTCGTISEWANDDPADPGDYVAALTTNFSDGTQCVASEPFTLEP